MARMKRTITLASIFLMAVSALPAHQNQKDNDLQQACNAARSQSQMNQCAGEQYHKADARLNAVYQKALEIMQRNLADAKAKKDAQLIKYDQDGIEKLKAAERAWIQYRNLHCDAAGQRYEGGSMRPMIWGQCMAETTLDRIKELRSAFEDGDLKLE